MGGRTGFGEGRVAAALLVLVVAFPLTGTFFPLDTYLFTPTAENPAGSNETFGRLTTGVYALLLAALPLLVRRVGPLGATLRGQWPLLAFLAWTFASALWAEDPLLSFNRSARLLVHAGYGAVLAGVADERHLVPILLSALLIGLLASLAVTLVAPDLSQALDARGAYRGAFIHKNFHGFFAGLAIPVALLALRLRALPIGLAAAAIPLAAVSLVLANSATADLAAAAATACVLYGLATLRGPPRDRLFYLVVGAIGFGAAALAGYALLDAVLGARRDLATLTGRAEIWSFAWAMIDQEPLLGWGHGAWLMPAFAAKALSQIHFGPPHAHNTWIDLRLQLGMPGLLLFAALWLALAGRALAALLASPRPEAVLWAGLLVYLTVIAYSETIVLAPSVTYGFWIALALGRSARLAREVRRARMEASAMAT